MKYYCLDHKCLFFVCFRYIEMFGLKFSKEDHIAIIKLFYGLLTIPKLEPLLVEKFAMYLSLLIR